MFNSNNILLQTTYDSPGLLLILPKNNEYFKKVFLLFYVLYSFVN